MDQVVVIKFDTMKNIVFRRVLTSMSVSRTTDAYFGRSAQKCKATRST